MQTGIINRIKKVEARSGPGHALEALVIPRRPEESREQAAERFFTEYPERRGDKAPRIYLSLMRGQETSWAKAICTEEI